MTQEMKDKWLLALLSGKYKQGQGKLHHPDTNTYCCLGVLEHACDGKVETYESYNQEPKGSPTLEWYKGHGIEVEVSGYVNPAVVTDKDQLKLIDMNDGRPEDDEGETVVGQKSFVEIAHWIEKNIEVIND